MPKTKLVGAVLLLAGAGALIRQAVSMQTPGAGGSQEPKTAVLLMLGEKATSVERWDGKATVSGAMLSDTAGRHFSAGDAVTGAGAWKCTTRRDEVPPYADIHYTEMRPGSVPAVLFQPVGVYLTVSGVGGQVEVSTTQGDFNFSLAELSAEPKAFLNGRATARIVPAVEKLSGADYEDDEPSIAALPDGLAVAWVAYRDRADRVLMRTMRAGVWSAAEEVTPKPGDLFRCSVVANGDGLWVFWSERDGQRWHIWAHEKRGGSWQKPVKLTEAGSNTFHRAAAGGGRVFVAWQSYRGGQSDIYLRALDNGTWSSEVKLSESTANEWEPAIAAGSDGSAHVAWDSYEKGNYDVQQRSWQGGRLSALRAITTSPNFQAHVSIAADRENRPWVAWNESGVNWGKDQGFLIPTPLSVPLHQERWLRVARWDGERWMEPQARITGDNAEHPQAIFDGNGTLAVVFRRWTRRNARTIGSPMAWENYVTRLEGARWSTPQPIASSQGSIEKHAQLTRDSNGAVWAAWMTDNRPFSTQVPANADVFVGRVSTAAIAGAPRFAPLRETVAESIPVHSNEVADVKSIRGYTIQAGKPYKIYRGDMHRHTDVSQDFKYDGSLIEVYRYGLDAAGMDYIAPTDHQTGYDHEFTWWQNQKLVDLFYVEGAFTPLFAYERSLPYPNGHRNVIWAQRGFRTLPIPEEERLGREGAKKLHAQLRKERGISMPHSSATAQGTDWRDNDPEVEPLIEIYQGYRTSYEYEGAPRAASTLNQHAQKSGWQPEGFWWNALAKGYKLGVQSSSDHWSTHISYACIVSESPTREGLLDAMRKRHAYAATDNIVLDFRAVAGGTTYIMGDAFTARSAPQLSIRAIGTGAIKQVDLIKNRTFVYTARPASKEARFEFTDKQITSGESWYYVRVLQEDGQIAWSSPIWVSMMM